MEAGQVEDDQFHVGADGTDGFVNWFAYTHDTSWISNHSVWHCVRCWWLVVGCTFDFGADDVDERSEKRRRADETDPVAVTHFASASSAGRQAGQTWHLSDFLVAAAAVITLLHLSMREEIRKRNGHDIQESHPTGTLDDAYNSQSSIKETDKRTNEQCAVTGTPKKSLSF